MNDMSLESLSIVGCLLEINLLVCPLSSVFGHWSVKSLSFVFSTLSCVFCICVPFQCSSLCLSSSVSLVSVFCQFFVTSSGPWLLQYPTKYL